VCQSNVKLVFIEINIDLILCCIRRLVLCGSGYTVELVYFRMYGFFQTTFYFGYMALFSIALGIMCGK